MARIKILPPDEPVPPTAEGVINSILQGTGGGAVDGQALVVKMVHHFGGIDEFCKTLHEEFEKAAKGSVARQRILVMIADLLQRDRDLKRQNAMQIEDLPTEDLERVLNTYLGERFGLKEKKGKK